MHLLRLRPPQLVAAVKVRGAKPGGLVVVAVVGWAMLVVEVVLNHHDLRGRRLSRAGGRVVDPRAAVMLGGRGGEGKGAWRGGTDGFMT